MPLPRNPDSCCFVICKYTVYRVNAGSPPYPCPRNWARGKGSRGYALSFSKVTRKLLSSSSLLLARTLSHDLASCKGAWEIQLLFSEFMISGLLLK